MKDRVFNSGGSPRAFKREAGFTLVELMVVTVSLVILTVVAIPSFRTMIMDNRMSSSVNGLVFALQSARSEAVKLSNNVTVCSVSATSAWKDGWNVITGADCTVDAGERTLLHGGSQEGMEQVKSAVTSLTFRRNGQVNAAASFTFCDSRGGTKAREVDVSVTGRIHTVTKQADNSALDCS